MAAAPADPGALAKQCKELQRKLDEALRERDDLVRDLESLCLSDGGTTFSSSSVLQERIYSTGKRQQRAGQIGIRSWVLGAGCWVVLGAAAPLPPAGCRPHVRCTTAVPLAPSAFQPARRPHLVQRRSWRSTAPLWQPPPLSGTVCERTWRR